MEICNQCPLNVDGVCSKNVFGEVVRDFVYKDGLRHKGQSMRGCGCPLKAKVLSDSPCPLGKF